MKDVSIKQLERGFLVIVAETPAPPAPGSPQAPQPASYPGAPYGANVKQYAFSEVKEVVAFIAGEF